jgi:hypothetical protein
METRAGLSGRSSPETNQQQSGRRRRKLALLTIIGVIIAAVVGGTAVSCGDDGTTAGPTVTFNVTPSVEPSPTAGEETPETPATPEGEDEYEGWLTYTNDVYKYEFRYPPGAEITEAPMEAFSVPTEEFEAGVTFEDVYEQYTGKVCISVQYELGYINFSGSSVESSDYITCGRTGRAYEGPDREETLLIDGGTYTAHGFEEQGPGETLDYHNETLGVLLDDGTGIQYGAAPSETATFADYLMIRDDLLRIVQSYRALP